MLRAGASFPKTHPSFFKGQYFLYYSLGPYINGAAPPGGLAADMWTIGITSSSDLTHWHKVGELLPGGNYEKKGLAARVLNGQVHLFYQAYGNDPNDAICHATSGDGIHFSRNASNPIFKPSGSWTAGRAIDAEVFPVGDRLMLYFATRDVAYKIQKIGVASAPLASDFARQVANGEHRLDFVARTGLGEKLPRSADHQATAICGYFTRALTTTNRSKSVLQPQMRD